MFVFKVKKNLLIPIVPRDTSVSTPLVSEYATTGPPDHAKPKCPFNTPQVGLSIAGGGILLAVGIGPLYCREINPDFHA